MLGNGFCSLYYILEIMLLVDKNEKLRQSVQDLESVQSQMVSMDVVLTYMETISKSRSEYKQLEDTHKEMIQR